MKYEFFIGLRYLRSKRRQRFISIIGVISILGVFMGVMALNVVLSVMGGFEDELKQKILGVNSHLVILSYDGAIGEYNEISEKVRRFPGVVGVSPFVYSQAMIVGTANVVGVVVRGVAPESAGDVTNIESAIGKAMLKGRHGRVEEKVLKEKGREVLLALNGETKTGSPPIIIGKELASNLGVIVGDTVSLVAPFGKIGPFGTQAKVRKYEVIGIFDYGMLEYDSGIVYLSLNEAMSFFELDGKATGIEVKIRDVYKAKTIGEALLGELGYPFYTRNWEEVNESLFHALRLERIAIGIFLGLIILVAALDIISTLTMVVMEKGKDIAILRTMGATKGGIMRIFIIDGMIIGFVGTLFGTLAGFGILYLIKTSEAVKNLIPFDPKVYPISEFPVKLEPIYFIVVGLVSLFICFLATLYPSYQASRKEPVEALRYE
jgi:lipoprotein-releasing system permease protein